MERELAEFQNEIEVLTRIVNGYLKTNHQLQDFEVNILSIKPKSAPQMDAIADSGENDNDRGFLGLRDVVAKQCKICQDGNGNAYCYFGPNGCPKF